jgi:C4-dicarboxylate transporter DctM subunit
MFANLGMAELSLVLLGFMVVILASGVWIAVALGLVGFVAMALTTSVPLGTVLATTTWSASSQWTLAALPLFIWMGEILFRTKLS